jgi:NADPH:quinone reductase-like Zn-dependent oxidoreductase
MSEMMKAMVYNSEGMDKMIWTKTFPVPEISDHEVLIKTGASSLNPFDFRLTESPSMFSGFNNKPVGCDVAGTIAKVGKNVTGFKVGDKVFGWGAGLAEFTVSDPTRIAKVPNNMRVEDFAIFPCVGVTAWQLLEKYWISKPNFQLSSLVVIGAAGAVGSCLIQMARQFGGPELKIFAISSSKNEDYLKGLGASHFVDYSAMKSSIPEKSADLIVDLVSGITDDNFVLDGMRFIKPATGKYLTLNTLMSTETIADKLKSSVPGVSLRDNYELFVVNRTGSSQHLEKIAAMVTQGQLKLHIAEDLEWNEQSIRSGFNKLKQRHHPRGKFRVIIS